MRVRPSSLLAVGLASLCASGLESRERLGGGRVAIRTADGGIFASWRPLGSDPRSAELNVYRHAGGTTQLLHTPPIRGATNFFDTAPSETAERAYRVRLIVERVEQHPTQPVAAWCKDRLESRIDAIEDYRPGDAAGGDLNGKGRFEIARHRVGPAWWLA